MESFLRPDPSIRRFEPVAGEAARDSRLGLAPTAVRPVTGLPLPSDPTLDRRAPPLRGAQCSFRLPRALMRLGRGVALCATCDCARDGGTIGCASMRKRVLPWPLPNAVTRQAPGTGLARTCAEPPSFRRRPDSCGRNPIPRHSRLFGGSRMRARGAAVSRAPRSACGRRFAVARCTGVQSAGGPRAPAGPGAKEEKA
jgi:hypothetical protein